MPNRLFSEDVFDFIGLKELLCQFLAQCLCQGAQGSRSLSPVTQQLSLDYNSALLGVRNSIFHFCLNLNETKKRSVRIVQKTKLLPADNSKERGVMQDLPWVRNVALSSAAAELGLRAASRGIGSSSTGPTCCSVCRVPGLLRQGPCSLWHAPCKEQLDHFS